MEADKQARKKCYIYTRVSTEIQTEGYSLDAQRERLLDYAKYQKMQVVKEYCDAGKSGKNTSGRPEFQNMMLNIKEKRDSVDYVLVFKLSRFGRNAADVLNNLQEMQDYGVNLISVEDGIDSSKDAGKLMVAVLSAVAEIERENILVQTMEGRRQKAREGRWNGGQAPWGYSIGEDGVLQVNEEEAPLIRKIFELYADGGLGINGVAKWLNDHGYERKLRGNGKYQRILATFVKSVLDNPVYVGKIAYGRRENEKIEGKRNEYHKVLNSNYKLYDGLHQPLISEDLWERTHRKRTTTGVKKEKNHNFNEHCHLLSGLLRCPVCGGPMYGIPSRKKKKDGTYYKETWYYVCNNHRTAKGKPCSYSKQIRQDVLDSEVHTLVARAVNETSLVDYLSDQICGSDEKISSLKTSLEQLEKSRDKKQRQREKYLEKIKDLDIDDANYDDHYNDLQNLIDECLADIKEFDSQIASIENTLENSEANNASYEETISAVKQMIDNLNTLSPEITRRFYRIIIDNIQIYPEVQPSGYILKTIQLVFPISFYGYKVTQLSISNETGEQLYNDLVREQEAVEEATKERDGNSESDGETNGETAGFLRNESSDETVMLLSSQRS